MSPSGFFGASCSSSGPRVVRRDLMWFFGTSCAWPGGCSAAPVVAAGRGGPFSLGKIRLPGATGCSPAPAVTACSGAPRRTPALPAVPARPRNISLTGAGQGSAATGGRRRAEWNPSAWGRSGCPAPVDAPQPPVATATRPHPAVPTRPRNISLTGAGQGSAAADGHSRTGWTLQLAEDPPGTSECSAATGSRSRTERTVSALPASCPSRRRPASTLPARPAPGRSSVWSRTLGRSGPGRHPPR